MMALGDVAAKPTTRADARALGLTFYFTGRPCPAGHICERYVSNGMCKACGRERDAECYAKPKVKARVAARHATNYQKPEIRARQKAWRKNNWARVVQKENERIAADRERYNAVKRAWRLANPEKMRAIQARKRTSRAGGSFTAKDVAFLLSKQRRQCVYCRVKLSKKFHVDHVMPLALGGANTKENIQILCRKCNQRKSWKHPLDFARQEGRLL